MAIDGSEDSARHIREMERTPELTVTMPNLVDDDVIDNAVTIF